MKVIILDDATWKIARIELHCLTQITAVCDREPKWICNQHSEAIKLAHKLLSEYPEIEVSVAFIKRPRTLGHPSKK